MGRKRRIHFPGAVSHAMSKGNDGMDIFENDDDRRMFLAILVDVKVKAGLLILAYCLMSNHFHILVAVAQATLASIMHQVLSRYSHWFNWRKTRHGHLFQDRYKAKLCLDDQYLSQVLPYIHRNPVKAGLVSDPADWEWSSHRQFMKPPRSILLDLEPALARLADTPKGAMRRYKKLMGDSSDWEPDYDEFKLPPPPVVGPIIRPTLEEIAAITESQTGRKFVGVSGQERTAVLSGVRRKFALKAHSGGYAQREIARFLDLSPSSIHGLLHSGP